MLKLIKNELIKILKRKNIYIIFILGFLIITIYNIYQKISNSNMNTLQSYKRAYNNDILLINNYEQSNSKEDYSTIIERMKLEEYAIKNNINYNILLNSENKNIPIPKDARILLMQVFNNFDIIIIFIIIYLSSTIITEEFNSGTIKCLLTKPYSRTKILLSKVLTTVLVTLVLTLFIVIFQYLFGGILFGFDSYSLDAIIYNNFLDKIVTQNLKTYMGITFLAKIPMYLILTSISLLLGIITNNMALNILISLGLYIVSTVNILINDISKYLFIYNWDISKYLFTNDVLLKQSLIISTISLLVLFVLLIIIFKNKNVKNE